MADLVPESEQQYGSILTVLGESAEQNGKMLKKPVEFTHIAFGDANDTYVQPDRKSQSLVNELYRIPVNSVDVLQATPDSVPILTVEALLPDDIHDVVIREFAAVATFNGQEYFHAIGNCARIYVPSPINNGQINNPVSLEMTFVITSAEPIVLINPNVITASRSYVIDRTSSAQNQLAGGVVFPFDSKNSAKIGDEVTSGVKALRIAGQVFTLSEEINENAIISHIDLQKKLVTIGGEKYAISPLSLNFRIEPYAGLGQRNNNIPERSITKYNWPLDLDDDLGSPLTIMWDESIPKLKFVDLILPDATSSNATPNAITEIVNEARIDRFRVKANITGDDCSVKIYVQSLGVFTAQNEVLSESEILSPQLPFYASAQSYIRVKKGVGQGKIAIDYQHQEPKSKSRKKARIWIIDLDDGLPVRDYDLLLPFCSYSTLNGQTKLSDSVSLNWVVECISGQVEVLGAGINPENSPVELVYSKNVSPSEVAGMWMSPYITCKDVNRIRVFVSQKTALDGTSTTASNVKVEVDL
ncbi:phage tail protein [Vibrio vulnificus]|uniref:phage tail-collar fiber domain-containing protein n=1 Tax=Vibrio vulnificus TaxID=672 RepID=UPI000B4D350C|nr:phage tail protein [Vibrio vulnificus]ASC56504.1 hypothetical protein FORC37_0810 [Vibrio vulnificus]EHU9449550.1 phage tail protein [Vibrio vulnificus]EHV9836792.1 phage tail protein [Vibrio vulnificus]MCG6265327.1 phage tail protein [Vibrio vulnificus]